jgi:hypothetical protein
MIKTRFLITVLFCATISLCSANEALLARFFLQEPSVPRWQPVSIYPLPEVDRSESPVETYNRGVELNNQALDAMNGKDYARATRLLSEACQLVPGEKGFWSNYLVALKNGKGREQDVVNTARIILAFDENNSQAAYAAGLVDLNDLKQPAKAIPYIVHA